MRYKRFSYSLPTLCIKSLHKPCQQKKDVSVNLVETFYSNIWCVTCKECEKRLFPIPEKTCHKRIMKKKGRSGGSTHRPSQILGLERPVLLLLLCSLHRQGQPSQQHGPQAGDDGAAPAVSPVRGAAGPAAAPLASAATATTAATACLTMLSRKKEILQLDHWIFHIKSLSAVGSSLRFYTLTRSESNMGNMRVFNSSCKMSQLHSPGP